MDYALTLKAQARTARIAGLLYTLMVPLAAFGILFIPTKFIVEGDAAATVANLLANEGTFRLGILSALTVQVCHIFIVLLLYKLLQPVNRNMAVLMVVFMLTSIPLAMLNELNHFAALFAACGGTAEMVEQFFKLYDAGILIAGIFWGLWLFPMGILVYRSQFLPKTLGVVLLVASVFYVIDSFLSLGVSGYEGTAIAQIIEIPLYGEILFPLWLLIRGVKPSLNPAQ